MKIENIAIKSKYFLSFVYVFLYYFKFQLKVKFIISFSFERVKKGPARKDNAITKVKQELQSTVNLMKNNLHKAMNRGEMLEDLEAKSG